jgi:hypothetical protein
MTPDAGPAMVVDEEVADGAPGNGRRPSDRQVEAVYAVMRLLRDDRPSSPDSGTIVCDCCRRDRPARGSVSYGSLLLCNGCATDYELLRIAHSIRGIDDFLGRR